MKLGILTATWGRPALTRQVLSWYTGISIADVTIELVAVRSPEDPEPHKPVPGWRYLDWPNAPLGKKWNAGTQVMRELEVDAMMVVGSDNLVSRKYFDVVVRLLRHKRVSTTYARDAYVYVPPSDKVMYLHSVTPGVGRVLAADALDYLHWKPWQADINKHLDASMMSRIRQAPITRNTLRKMSEREFAILDIKRDDGPQMWRVVRKGDNDHRMRSNDGTEMNIRKVTYFSARHFFKQFFPHIPDYKSLGLPHGKIR